MQQAQNKQKKIGWLSLATLVFIIIAGVSTQSFLTKTSAQEADSVEVGFTSLSPQGEAGGAIIPASCESGLDEGGVAHWAAYWAWVPWSRGDGDGADYTFFPADTSGSCSSTPVSTPASLHICPSSATVTTAGAGNTIQLQGWYTPADTSFAGCAAPNGLNINDRFTWSSSNPSRATVTNYTGGSGLVTGVAQGSTRIGISYAGLTAFADISVVAPPTLATCGTATTRAWSTTPNANLCGNGNSMYPVTLQCTYYNGDDDEEYQAQCDSRIRDPEQSRWWSWSCSMWPSNNATGCSAAFTPAAASIPASLHICPSTASVTTTGSTNKLLLKGYDTPAGTSFTSCDNPNGTNRNDRYTWRSLSPSFATVNNNTGTAGWVTGVAPAEAVTITADYADVPGVSTATATIKVTAPAGPSCTGSCSSPAQQTKAATTCTGDTFTFNDSCGTPQTCNGTRSCNFNWTEVAP